MEASKALVHIDSFKGVKSVQKAEPFYSHNFTSHKAEITFYKFIRSAKVRFHIPNFEGSRSLWEKADLFHFLGLENQSRKSNTIRKHKKSNFAHPEL